MPIRSPLVIMFTLAALASLSSCATSTFDTVEVQSAGRQRLLDFGSTAVGSSQKASLEFQSRRGFVVFGDFSIRGDTRGSFSVGKAPDALDDGQVFSVEISYDPTQTGDDSASVVISLVSDVTPELVIPLHGRAL